MSKKIDPSSFEARLIFLLITTFLFAATSWASSIAVNVATSKGAVASGINVYAFTEAGSYTSKYATTDTSGTAAFDSSQFTSGNYKFRADYLGGQFWSQIVPLPDTPSVNLTIETATTVVTATTAAGPAVGVKVYLFSGAGSYLSIYGTTDTNGQTSFELPVGKDYKFRADILGNQYWSDVATIQSGDSNSIAINAGGGTLQVTVDKAAGLPLSGIKAYLFSSSGSYLSMYQTTDTSGIAKFSVPQGNYKVRADYMGSQFWTAVTNVTADTNLELTIPHQDVAITAQRTYQSASTPISGIKVYLFSSSGTYLSQYATTDGNGHVSFNLPEQPYKVRADYLGKQFWSEAFTWQDASVNIPMADAVITVSGAGQALEGVYVYAFSDAGSYLSIYGTTDSSGQTIFRLPAGSYKFRADYLGNQYWSGVQAIIADQINPIAIATGGGTFTLTVSKGSEPLAGLNCYLFNNAGTYLSKYATTDSAGQASFKLSDGNYKFRADYLGNQFWTGVYSVPTTLSGSLSIPHQDVAITVQSVYLTTTAPIPGINAYLFTSAGSYLSQYKVTDSNGQATFSLPQQPYKVRADYLGKQFWSSVFTWQNATISVPYGKASVHVTKGSTNVQNAKVYLFSDSGSYLSKYATTDSSGIAEFIIPAGSYKFRADEGSNQKFSDVVTITADQTKTVNIDLSNLPTVSFSASPAGVLEGGTSTLTWSTTNTTKVTIDNNVGEVALSGSTTVTPNATTTYALTAEGPGGTTTATVIVTVIAPPADIDLGVDQDEQQGGGGLVGETIRVLNGNVVESRTDLNFSTPNKLGLSLGAFYNSRSTNIGPMGYGWSHTYDASLNPSFNIGGVNFLRIADGTGKAHYFRLGTSGEFEGVFAEKTYVELISGTYIWHLLDGSRYGFSTSGKLSWMDDAIGNRLNLAYDGNSRLQTVTDTASGRVLTFHYNVSNLIYEIVGPVSTTVNSGIWVSYSYTNNNLTSVTYADGSGFNYAYTDSNDVHNLTEKKDKAGHLIDNWAYDSSDRATSNFSRDGKGVSIVYASATQINVTDAYNKQREYLLTAAAGRKRVSAITDGPDGAAGLPYSDSNIVSWVYDSQMRPTEMSTERDITTEYSDFDERGNPGTVTLASGTADERIIDYTWHPFINTPLTRTEPSVFGSGDKETIWDYDNDYDAIPNENPTALVSRVVERGYTKNATGSIVSYEYITTYHCNSKGQVTSIDGPLAGTADTTSFTYNPTTGDLLTIVRPLIGTTTFAVYDAAGQASNVTDVNNHVKAFTYDGKGRVTDITNNADSSTSSMAYNTAGTLDSQTDEDDVTTTFDYDSTYGRLSTRTDSQGNYISYSYDDQGNVTGKDYYDSSNVKSNSKSYLYTGSNLPGLLYRETDGEGHYTQYGYDLDGNVYSVRDPNGNTTYYDHDFQNRLKTVTQPGSVMTQYGYDGHGNLQSVTDANNRTTTYQYDDMARLVSTTSPDTGTTTYAYDEAGNPVNKKDAKAVSVIYSYDVLNRLTNVDFPSDTDITYSYDSGTNGMGQRTGMTDASGSYTFGYDARGRLTGKTSVINGVNYTLSRAYTPGSRISSMTYPSGRTVNYYRTECACKVDSITTTKSGVTTSLMSGITYRPFGGLNALNNGAGGTVGSTHNSAGKLTVSNPGAAHERSYTYDNNGNIKTINSILAADQAIYDRTYDYDALNRLTSSEGPWGGIDYTYDNVGNRQSETTDLGTNVYSYVSGTNLLSSVTGTTTTGYSYDSNGNITSIGTKTLSYNQDNRLISVVQGTITLGVYTYNGLGQRIKKVAGATTTIFHYDFDGNIIGESDASGIFSKEYLYNGSSRLAMVDVGANKVYYYGNDRQGTPEIVTDSNNIITWEAVYKPFGDAGIQSYSSVTNNFRFPGQYYDQETGLHYNYNRYYDPSTGRYLTPDPIGIEGGTNLFAYVENNPINDTDPKGLFVPRRHNRITWAAAGKECPKLKDILPQLTAYADFVEGTQDVENSYQHSMTDGKHGQSAASARKQRDEWVESLLSQCDVNSLSRALHAMQDEYSEAHDFKPWKGGIPSPWHLWKDSYGALGAPSKNAEAASIALIKRFKEHCPCVCDCNN